MIKKRTTASGTRYDVRFRGPDGKMRNKTCRTRREAEQYERQQRSALDKGAWVDPRHGALTLTGYAMRWMGERHTLRPRTVELYESLLRCHILPAFGSTALARITPGAVRAWNASLSQAHAVTAAKAYRLLRQLMATAVADELIGRTPCAIKGAGQEHSPERPSLSVQEVNALAGAMPEPFRISVPLASWCQLRLGEVLGLERHDVDLLHGTVRIERTAYTVSGKLHIGPPKTEAGVRVVSVPPHIIPALEAHLTAFVGPEPSAPLLTGAMGGRLGRHPLNAAWAVAREKLGRPDAHFHDLRHAGLTWAATQGATVPELMKRAGHASPAAALRYQHATDDRDTAIAQALSGLAESASLSPISPATRDIRAMSVGRLGNAASL